MRNNRKLDVIYIARTDGSDVRVQKEVTSLAKAGLKVLVYCYKSSQNYNIVNNENTEFYVIPLTQNSFLKKIVFYFWLNFISIYHIISFRPRSIHLVDEEGLIIEVVARLFGVNVVLDLFDSIELKSQGRSKLRYSFMRTVSLLCKKLATVIIVTDRLRLGLLDHEFHGKSLVLPNYPSENSLPTVNECFDSSRSRGDFSTIYLFLGGTIYKDRGVETILRLLDRTDNVRVLCAGWLYDEYAKSFVSHPKVEYYGVLSQVDANKLCSRAILNIALYAPSNMNNIFASPNKVYDSLCIGQHVLINTETKIAQCLDKSSFVLLAPYEDEISILNNINGIVNVEISRSSILRYRKLFSWERWENNLIKAHV